jgi:mannose-6-phosphate isomerase-like protein (cupin superfamily)
MKQALLAVGVAVAIASPAFAQDAVKADPKHYKVVAENERVRVLKATYGPGEKSVMHEHPDTFAVFLTDVNVRFTFADGKSVEATRKPGDAMVDAAVKHQPENLGAAKMEAIIVEVKPGVSAPPPVAGAVPPVSGDKISRTPIVSGPHGEAVLLKSEPGYEEPAGSKHDYDAVVVPMTDAGAALTMGGKTVTMKKGQAYLISRGAAHSVKATAAGETVVVYVK